jgi:hypothetical protein
VIDTRREKVRRRISLAWPDAAIALWTKIDWEALKASVQRGDKAAIAASRALHRRSRKARRER